MNTQPEGTQTQLDRHLAMKCEVCGQTNWGTDPERFALIAVGPGPDTAMSIDARATKAISVRVLVCNGCGAIRLLDSKMAEIHR
jgi:translation initiation factor 2 beta subunit (eIF-2beta)/eIF-5